MHVDDKGLLRMFERRRLDSGRVGILHCVCDQVRGLPRMLNRLPAGAARKVRAILGLLIVSSVFVYAIDEDENRRR